LGLGCYKGGEILMEDIKRWLLEGLKTAIRIGLFAFLAALTDGLRQTLTGVSFDEQTKWGIMLLLTGLDKAIFMWKKETESRMKVLGFEWKGLSPV